MCILLFFFSRLCEQELSVLNTSLAIFFPCQVTHNGFKKFEDGKGQARACLAVAGFKQRAAIVTTDMVNRSDNMLAFATAALELLEECILRRSDPAQQQSAKL